MIISVLANQTLLDVCIQCYGTIEAMMALCLDNDLEIDDDVVIGQQLYIQDSYPAVADSTVADYLRNNNIVVTSDSSLVNVMGTNDNEIITTNDSEFIPT